MDNLTLWSDTAFSRTASTKPLTYQEKALIEAQKEQQFNMLWNSPDGVKRTAFAMKTGLKTRLDYIGVGRKLLMVDELPSGEIPQYDLDIPEYGAVKISERGQAPTYETFIKRISIPTFTVAGDTIVKKEELSFRRYPIFDRAKERSAISVAIAEDDMIMSLVKTAAVSGPNSSSMPTYGSSTTAISKAEFATLFGNIAERQLFAKTYLLGMKTYSDILKWSSTDLDPVSLNIQIETGNFGSIFGTRAIASTRLDTVYGYDGSGNNQQPVFALTTPDKLGRLPERKSVEVQIFDNIPKLQYEIVAMEIIGMGIYNCGGVSGMVRSWS